MRASEQGSLAPSVVFALLFHHAGHEPAELCSLLIALRRRVALPRVAGHAAHLDVGQVGDDAVLGGHLAV